MKLAPRLQWRKAFTFATECDGWKKNCFLAGLWILLFPPVGWLLALGFRKEMTLRLIDNHTPVIPQWTEWRAFLMDGIRASGVIYLYFLPFMLSFAAFALTGTPEAKHHALELLCFAVCVPLCIPVLMPGLPLLYSLSFDWLHLETWQITVVAVLFCLALFLMPAAFGRVSLKRNFRAALNIKAVANVIARDPLLYLEAWIMPLILTTAAFLLFPIAPWLILWSYLTGSYAFNNALALSGTPEAIKCFAGTDAFK